MKLKKGQLSDIIWIVILLFFLFTPIGFHARVQVMRLLSFSPSIEKKESYIKLSNYNWYLTDSNGKQSNFIEHTDKVIFLNYWATWCPPCIAEMPSLVELNKDYGDKVEFVFLANDDKDKVKSYLEKKDYHIPVYFKQTKTPEELKSSSLPTTFIINKKGDIVIKEVGVADWNSKKVRDLLDNLLNED